MNNNTGIYETTLKNGVRSYRVSITYRRKHISLGSFCSCEKAKQVYSEARKIIDMNTITPEDYSDDLALPHDKFISIVNLKNNGLYFHTPIYLRKQYFEYYLRPEQILKFDRDDLFFYSAHKIQQRGGYLFVSDYGSQYKILGRYGIKPFAVYGRDYIMINGDRNDYRYSNIRILNNYTGVLQEGNSYTALIHINGNYIIGRYASEITAAIAYNKAVDTLHANGFTKAYLKNYIVSLSKDDYLKLYNSISISPKLAQLTSPDSAKLIPD